MISEDSLFNPECQLRLKSNIDAVGLDCLLPPAILSLTTNSYFRSVLTLILLLIFDGNFLSKSLYLVAFLFVLMVTNPFTFSFPKSFSVKSAVSHILQCLISKDKANIVVFILLVIIMSICLDLKYAPLLITLLSKNDGHKGAGLLISLCLLVIGMVVLSWYSNIFVQGQNCVLSSLLNALNLSHNNNTYIPSFGILWYFDALVLPEYAVYFSVLHTLLPWIAVSILTLIYSEAEERQLLVRLLPISD